MASKYNMDVNITGNVERQLDGMIASMGKLISESGKMRESMQKGGDGIEQAVGNTKTMAVDALTTRFQNMAAGFKSAVDSMRGVAEGWIKSIISDAALFEDTESELRFAFKDGWQDVMEQVKKDATDLTFTFQEVASMAASLGRMNINPFGGTSAESQLFMSRNGQQIRALQVLQDTADSAGKSTQDVLAGLRNALSGSWKSLQDRFDIPKDKINQWKKALEGAKDPQEKYNKLVAELAKTFGGAGLEKMNNYNKAMAQLPDMMQQLRAGIGAEGIKMMKDGVLSLVQAVAEFVKNKDVMHSLSEAFKTIGWAVKFAAQRMADLVRWAAQLITAMPWLPKLLVVVLAIGTALASFAAVAASIAAFVMGLEALGVTLGGLASGAALLLPALVLIAGAFAVLGVAGKVAIDMFKTQWGPGLSLFEKIGLVFKAMTQLIDTYNGTTGEMDLNTAEALDKAGLMGTVTTLFDVWHKLNGMWEAFMDTLDDAIDVIGPVVVPLLGEMKDMFLELAHTLGLTDAATQASGSSAEDWASVGRSVANVIVSIVRGLVQMTRFVVGVIRLANAFGLVDLAILSVKATFWLLTAPIILIVKLIAKLIDMVSGGSFSKAISLITADVKERFSDKTGHDLQRKTAAVEGAGDPYATKGRLAGGAYRDAKGQFMPAMGIEGVTADEASGMSQEDQYAMARSAGLSEDDIARNARGRARRGRAKGGIDYAYAQDTFKGGLSQEMGGIETAKNGDVGLNRETSQKMMNGKYDPKQQELLTDILAELRKGRSIQIDGHEVAKHVNNAGQGIGGGHH